MMNQFVLTKQPITDAEFSAFEQEINLSLQESYKKHILKNNGGSLHWCEHPAEIIKGYYEL